MTGPKSNLAHALKGSAGNLGATRVQAAAEALQAAIRQDAGQDEINRCVQTLNAELLPLLDGIRNALAVEPLPLVAGHPAPAAVDPIRLDAVLARLDSLLETETLQPALWCKLKNHSCVRSLARPAMFCYARSLISITRWP